MTAQARPKAAANFRENDKGELSPAVFISTCSFRSSLLTEWTVGAIAEGVGDDDGKVGAGHNWRPIM
jgi:hypothetical protein